MAEEAGSDVSPELFRALADPVRRQLMQRLVAGPASAGDLARALALPRVNISHHLGVLAAAGLIEHHHRRASAGPDALSRLRRYFDVALTTAAITPVLDKAQR